MRTLSEHLEEDLSNGVEIVFRQYDGIIVRELKAIIAEMARRVETLEKEVHALKFPLERD